MTALTVLNIIVLALASAVVGYSFVCAGRPARDQQEDPSATSQEVAEPETFDCPLGDACPVAQRRQRDAGEATSSK